MFFRTTWNLFQYEINCLTLQKYIKFYSSCIISFHSTFQTFSSVRFKVKALRYSHEVFLAQILGDLQRVHFFNLKNVPSREKEPSLQLFKSYKILQAFVFASQSFTKMKKLFYCLSELATRGNISELCSSKAHQTLQTITVQQTDGLWCM